MARLDLKEHEIERIKAESMTLTHMGSVWVLAADYNDLRAKFEVQLTAQAVQLKAADALADVVAATGYRTNLQTGETCLLDRHGMTPILNAAAIYRKARNGE